MRLQWQELKYLQEQSEKISLNAFWKFILCNLILI